MRFILTILLSFFTTQGIFAISWNMPWIEYDKPNRNSQIWFRKQYIFPDAPTKACISIASIGKYVLYINERNVSRDVLLPYNDSEKIGIMTFDVTRFLKKGTNTVAIWYSPDLKYNFKEQISLYFYGQTKNNYLFSFTSDSTWLCKESNVYIDNEGNEVINAPEYTGTWKSEDFSISEWQLATSSNYNSQIYYTDITPVHKAERISKIYEGEQIENCGDSILCDFGQSFSGWVRITLRGARKGGTINVNGLKYTCTGLTDEQACRRFTKSESGRVMIIGYGNISLDNIIKIEGIRIEPYIHNSYLY